MPGPDPRLLDLMLERIHAMLGCRQGLQVFGICGAQGSGKSTLCAALERELTGQGVPTALLSLDDLYLTRTERQALAREVHPLFATRGVPGTHDVALGLATIAALDRGEPAPLPRFDKGADDRAPETDWPRAPAGTRVLLLEGWCLGARPEPAERLAAPVNPLEAEEDPETTWRIHANTALAGPYQHLFARIDHLTLLAAPDWHAVAKWREEAEANLRTTTAAPRAMSPAQLARFIQHYQRLTTWILDEMPARADLVVRLDEGRSISEVEEEASTG